MLAAETSGRLKDETDPRLLFEAFTKIYDHHEAESVFPWAAHTVKFYEPRIRKEMKRGPYWIKGLFLTT